MTSVCILLQSHYEVDIRARRKAEALAKAGYDVDVLALRSPSATSKSYTLNGVNVETISLGKKRGSLARYTFEYLAFFLWAFYRVFVLMGRKHYAVIDANNLPDFLVFAGGYAKWRGAKVVLDMHEITPEFYISKYKIKPASWIVKLLEYIEYRSCKFADYVININQLIEDVLVSRGLAASKSTIVMNSVDEEFFSEAGASGKSSITGPQQPEFLMMYHGTITGIYGLDIAIEAFALAYREMPGAEFWVLGRRVADVEALEDRARALGLESKVKFVGLVPAHDIPHWLQRCDAGILPTRQDIFLDLSFSGKLSEYIITGKPVIASRLKTIRHYFSEEALAFFEPHNEADLARQMVSLYSDPIRRERLAERARREYMPIRWDVMKERYLKLMADITGHQSGMNAHSFAESAAAGVAGIRR